MKRDRYSYVSIGNGLFARSGQPKTSGRFRNERALDAYLRATCPHAKRDPRGICYECGHKEAK